MSLHCKRLGNELSSMIFLSSDFNNRIVLHNLGMCGCVCVCLCVCVCVCVSGPVSV